MIQVKLLCETDADAFFDFEVRTREYFEAIHLGRKADYYQRDIFQVNYEKQIADQEKGVHFLYGVWSDAGKMIGRVKLYDVQRGVFEKAEIGFRLEPAYQGQGLMTNAVKFVLDQAKSIRHLHRIEARTASYNKASQRVLEKSGFENIGKWREYFHVDGVRYDCMLYDKIIGGA